MKNLIWVIVVLIVVVVIVSLVRRDDGETAQQEAPASEPVEEQIVEVVEKAAEPAPVIEEEPEKVQVVSTTTDMILDNIPLYDNSTVIESTFENGRATRVFQIDPVVAKSSTDYGTTVDTMTDFYKQTLEDDGWVVAQVNEMKDVHVIGSDDGQAPISGWRHKRNFQASRGVQTLNFTVLQDYDASDTDEIQINARGYINVW